jgi:hypothetical protein
MELMFISSNDSLYHQYEQYDEGKTREQTFRPTPWYLD